MVLVTHFQGILGLSVAAIGTSSSVSHTVPAPGKSEKASPPSYQDFSLLMPLDRHIDWQFSAPAWLAGHPCAVLAYTVICGSSKVWPIMKSVPYI